MPNNDIPNPTLSTVCHAHVGTGGSDDRRCVGTAQTVKIANEIDLKPSLEPGLYLDFAAAVEEP